MLPQAALARTIGMSTTPLREALRRLKQEGLVELDAHRDARVGRWTAPRRGTCSNCAPLEPLAADLAAQRRTEPEIAALQDALGSGGASADPSQAQLESHQRFHAAIHRASHNALLVEMLDGIWVKTDRYRRHALEGGRTDEERAARATEHRLLFEAVRDGDPATAADLMRRHVESSLGARSVVQLAEPDRPTRQRPDDGRPAARRADELLALLLLHSALTQIVTFVLRPTSAYRAIELGVPATWLGVLTASFAVVPLFLAVPSGQATDRFGERRVMLVGSVLLSLPARCS